MTNVLLLGARRRVFFASRLRAALAVLGGGRVIGSDVDDLDPLQFFVDVFCLLPDIDDAAFLPALSALVARHEVHGIVPWNDRDIRRLDTMRAELERAGARLVMPPSPWISVFCDKRQTQSWCLANGIPQPALFGHARSARFPLIAKPRFGAGSVGVQRFDAAAELLARPDIAGDEWLLQELVDGDEYTVDVGLDRDGNPIFIVPRRRVKVRGGEVMIARVERAPDVVAFVEAICRCFDFSGFFNLQLIRGAQGCRLIEFNPRFGGGTDLSIEAGADIPSYAVELVRHGEIRSPPPPIRDGLVMSRYMAPVFFERRDAARSAA